jgi:hypothetical protein
VSKLPKTASRELKEPGPEPSETTPPPSWTLNSPPVTAARVCIDQDLVAAGESVEEVERHVEGSVAGLVRRIAKDTMVVDERGHGCAIKRGGPEACDQGEARGEETSRHAVACRKRVLCHDRSSGK